MTSLDDLRLHHASTILFECVAGSRAYGTGLRTSDEDIRGIFAVPAAAYLERRFNGLQTRLDRRFGAP